MNDGEERPAPLPGTPRFPWRWILLGAAGLVLLALVAFVVWLALPARGTPLVELLPEKPFAYLSFTVDRSDPAVGEIVARTRERLGGPPHGVVRRALVNALLPAALPDSFTAVLSLDAKTGTPQVVLCAGMGRMARLLRLFSRPVDRALLRGGALARVRVNGHRFIVRRGNSAGLRPSAYTFVGTTLVAGTSLEAVRESYDDCRTGGPRAAGADLAARLSRSLQGRDIVLYVDNRDGGMTRLVAGVSEKVSFAAFPTIDAVSTIDATISLLPERMHGTAVFSLTAPAKPDGVLSDVKFLFGALKRMARASGMRMGGEVTTRGNEVVFNFEIKDYLAGLSASSTQKGGE